MTGFLRATVLGVLVLAGLLVAVVEWVCWTKGNEWRLPLYWGGIAGFGLNALGYPFMLKLAALPAKEVKEGGGISWWVIGVLARMAGIGVLMYLWRGKFPGRENEVTLTAIAVYMAGMLAELVWVGRRLSAMDIK